MRDKITVEATNDQKGRGRVLTATFNHEMQDFQQALIMRIVDRLASKYVDEWGEEILASLDIETLKKKVGDKVTVKALQELSK